jgi:hypothetical protein
MGYVDQLPDGFLQPPISDWIVIDSPGELSEIELYEQRILASGLRPGQLMVYYQPAPSGDVNHWIGAVIDNDRIYPLASVNLVGPGMRRFGRSHSVNRRRINPQSSERWSRSSGAMGSKLFRAFRNNSVLLIGAGRLGSLLGTSLVRMGLRRLTVVDSDHLEAHNRDATFGNKPRDIGKRKCEVLIRHLHGISPNTSLRAIP